MPPGVGGALLTTNNVGIFLTILQGTPKNIVWRGFQNRGLGFNVHELAGLEHGPAHEFCEWGFCLI